VHDPVVVEDDALAGAQPEPHQVLRVHQLAPEGREGRIPGVEQSLVEVGDVEHVLADRHALHRAVPVELDHPLPRAHVVTVVLAVERHRRLGEDREGLRRLRAEIFGHRRPVSEEAEPALDAVRPAVQELHPRRGVLRRRVGVQLERLRRVGEVGRVDVQPHVEIGAEEGRPHLAHQLDRFGQALVAVGHPLDDGDALDDQRLDPVRHPRSVRLQLALGEPRDPRVVVRVPQPPRQLGHVIAHASLCIGRKPVEPVARCLGLADPADDQPLVLDPGCFGNRRPVTVEDVVDPLPRHRIERARIVVPQPPGVEIGASSIGQRHLETGRLAPNARHSPIHRLLRRPFQLTPGAGRS
jgi:hypothetical protein